MKQMDLLDWLDETAVIKAGAPSSPIQQREWLKAQLKPVMKELNFLQISPLCISEALYYYANQYAEQAQDDILTDEPL